MSFDNSILCKVCNGRNFENANGAFYCQLCGTESYEHGQDFVYEETNSLFANLKEFVEDSDSNDENHWKNYYPDEEDLPESNNEESIDEEELLGLENLEKSYLASDFEKQKFDMETEEESQEEQAGS